LGDVQQAGDGASTWYVFPLMIAKPYSNPAPAREKPGF
jgi:hypothetical protein